VQLHTDQPLANVADKQLTAALTRVSSEQRRRHIPDAQRVPWAGEIVRLVDFSSAGRKSSLISGQADGAT
jgi:hypothetical protein